MLHIKSVKDDKYEVFDSDSREVKVLSVEDIESIEASGSHIKGVAYIDNLLTITPVPPLYTTDRNELAKNRLVRGSYTGVEGFNLEVKRDRVIAKSLDEDYWDYIVKNKTDYRFVLAFPDIITDISEDFLSGCLDYFDLGYVSIVLDLPSSLKRIASSALSLEDYDAKVAGIIFNGVVDEIKSTTGHRSGTCQLDEDNEIESLTIRVRKLNTRSIGLPFSTSINTIHLPDTEEISFLSIASDGYSSIYLGESIRSLSHITTPLVKRSQDSDAIMRMADIVYLPDKCSLSQINWDRYDPTNSDLYFNDAYNSYIVVLSEDIYNELVKRYNNGELIFNGSELNSWVGVLTYTSEEDLEDINKNMKKYVKDYKKYFSSYLTKDDFNKIKRLELKR